jgi:RimJ/RimL family protein N-acetyltransferase
MLFHTTETMTSGSADAPREAAAPIQGPVSLRSPTHPALELRTATPADIAAVRHVFSNPKNTALDPVVSDPAVFTEEKVARMIAGWTAEQGKERPLRVSVVVIVDGSVQGVGGMGYIATDAETGARTGDAGVMLNEGVRGKGYALEAMRLTTDFAFDVLRLNKVTATMLASNVPMVRLMQKMKWRGRHIAEGEGEFGEEWMFEMLPEEWAERRAKEGTS